MDSTSDPRPEWVRRLEEKHGLPITKIPGAIYGLCYDPPIIVQSVSLDYAGNPPEHNNRGYIAAGQFATTSAGHNNGTRTVGSSPTTARAPRSP
jgi:hypothetical protein